MESGCGFLEFVECLWVELFVGYSVEADLQGLELGEVSGLKFFGVVRHFLVVFAFALGLRVFRLPVLGAGASRRVVGAALVLLGLVDRAAASALFGVRR